MLNIGTKKTNKGQEELLKDRYKRYYTWIGPIVNTPKAKAYTFLSISFLTVAFFIFFAIRPTINTIVGLQKQIADNKEVENKLQDKINALSQLQAEMNILEPDIPLIDTALPTKSEVVTLLKNVESLAQQNNASLSAVQIGEAALSDLSDAALQQAQIQVQQQNGVGEAIPVSFIFTVEGGYVNIANLINKITNLPRIVATQNVSISKSTGKIIGSVRFNAYYLP